MPYSFRTPYGEHFKGTADIFAATALHRGGILSLVIECKRADKEKKHWVFETRKETRFEPLYPFIFSIPDEGLHYANNLILPRLGYKSKGDYDKAIQSFEFKYDKADSKGPSKNQQDTAFKSIRQAYEPISSILPDHQLALALSGGSGVNTIRPIVVTTATLSVMKYLPEDVERSSGTIDSHKLELIPKKWIHYEYPLPESLRLEGRLLPKPPHTTGNIRPVKSPVFIVNADALDDFIQCMKNDVADYTPYK